MTVQTVIAIFDDRLHAVGGFYGITFLFARRGLWTEAADCCRLFSSFHATVRGRVGEERLLARGAARNPRIRGTYRRRIDFPWDFPAHAAASLAPAARACHRGAALLGRTLWREENRRV